MYVSPDFRTKQELIEAVKAGKSVSVFSPGPFPAKKDGIETVEGPHHPRPHRWYAIVLVKDGWVKKIIE